MNAKIESVFLFPGQGSQHRGMGEGLFQRYPELVQQADHCLGYSIEELCLRDPDGVLSRTEYTQPALYVVSVLHYHARRERDPAPPAFVAGHSLGEYCALHVAGAFDFVSGLKLVQRRGELMSRAPKGAMAAVLNLDQDRVSEIMARLPYRNIDVANINSRKQSVLSGVYDELMAPDVRDAFTAAGGLFIPLNVSAAFHSRCMAGVQKEFGAFLAGYTLVPPAIPVVANYTARPYPSADGAQVLQLQIDHPVRWYESMSWLIGKGHRTFEEIGPGNVLAKLSQKILQDPLCVDDPQPAEVWAPAVSRPQAPARRARVIFMYAGQGSQYHQMGRELYDTHPAFRRSMDRCSQLFQAATGTSLVNAVYDESLRGKEFDDIRYSHPALYSVGVSLTEVLREEGFEPDAVLGHSAGEYVALTAAGAISLEDGIRLVMGQARLLEQRCAGGLLSVLAPPSLVEERPDMFRGVTLAAVNFDGNFVLSGEADRLRELQAKLEADAFVAVRLPVRQGFHSRLIDEIRQEFLALAGGLAFRSPEVPIYSSAICRELGGELSQRRGDYLWDVVRSPIRFRDLMSSAFGTPDECYWVDLSASGSFATFLKHGFGRRYRCAPAINQFGNNRTSLAHLRSELSAFARAAA